MQTVYLFLLIVLFVVLYWQLPTRLRTNVAILTGLAGLFYVDRRSVIILVLLNLTTIAAISLLRSRRILAYVLGLGAGLSTLIFYKLSSFVGTDALPLGLSYFSLISIGLFLDFGRQKNLPPIEPSQLLSFGLIAPLFPFGPVERWSHLAPQLEQPRRWSSHRAAEGLFLIALGLFKKTVIADRLGKPYDDFRRVTLTLVGSEILAYMLLAFVHIFCDFSSLVDITRGISKLLGIDLLDNFNQPYFAKSVPDVWRRWHISLVNWLRDFIYTPVALRTKNLYLASFVVMLVVGIWHSATWNHFFWSLYWTALFSMSILLRQFGFRRYPPRIVSTPAMIFMMAISALIFVPKNMAEIVLLWTNFSQTGFRSGQFFETIEIGKLEAFVALASFGLVVAVETGSKKVNQSRYNLTTLPLLVFLGLAFLIFTLVVAYAIDSSIDFIYMRY